jgi:predicted transposase YdaD
LKESEEIRQALDMCEEGAFTEAELFAYEKCWDVIYTERAFLAASLAEGEARGRAEGREEGRAVGEAKGRAESLTGVVHNCKRNGFSLEQIQMITGFERDKIQEILRSGSEE